MTRAKSVLFASFGSLYCGYTLAVIISTLGQPTFYSSLGLVTDISDPGYGFVTAIISTANGIFFAGAFFGALLAGGLSSRLGRIKIFQMSSIVGIIGGAIQTDAMSAAMVVFFSRGMSSTNTRTSISWLDLSQGSAWDCRSQLYQSGFQRYALMVYRAKDKTIRNKGM
jgi:MFS family permease